MWFSTRLAAAQVRDLLTHARSALTKAPLLNKALNFMPASRHMVHSREKLSPKRITLALCSKVYMSLYQSIVQQFVAIQELSSL